MSNKTKQTKVVSLVLVLTVALILGLLGLAKKLETAHIKSIKGTIEEQFKGKR